MKCICRGKKDKFLTNVRGWKEMGTVCLELKSATKLVEKPLP